MSVFGQVWVFSAIAFVLGAFLAWLFLVRPAQRRIGELRRRLAEAQRAPKAATSTGSATSGAQNTLIAPAPGGDEDTPIASRTRRFGPAAETRSETAAGEATEHLAPGPRWPEQDSLRGKTPSTARSSELDELDEEFARIDAFHEEELAGSGDAPSGSAEPTEYPGGHAGRLNVDSPGDAGDTGGDAHTRRSTSLFDPASSSNASAGPASGTPPQGAAEGTSSTSAFGGRPDKSAERPLPERTTMLPKRQPGRSSLESFDRSKPIQPSMRPVERREPQSRPERGGSLFEPAVAPAPASDTTPPARDTSAAGYGMPPGPFGPGSAMPKPGGERPSPEFTVKASVTALRYCVEGSPEFPRMVAEVWFRSPDDAERVGFRPLS